MKNKGITLVALVITIIVLLILAAISIQALTNQGIFGKASEAKEKSEIANIKEQIALDIYEKQLEPPLGSITDEQLETILGKYGTVNKEDGTIVGITTEKGYEILLKDIYGGETVAESVPDGATVTPVNDITTWLKTAGISKQYSYTTIEQVIADSTCTQSLMNNENAMKYLARSTEFANAICASETTMTSLGKSTYVDDTVLNNDLWVSKIPMSPYWDKVSTVAVTLYGGALETITITGLYGSPTITTNSEGSVNYSLPIGKFTFSGSVSGQSFTKNVTFETSDVYVMPDGIVAYWYGNKCIKNTGDYFISHTGGSCNWETNRILLSSSSMADYPGITTNNVIPTGKNNILHAIVQGKTLSSDKKWACPAIGLAKAENGDYLISGYGIISNVSSTDKKELTGSLTDDTTDGHISAWVYSGACAYVYAIWIE